MLRKEKCKELNNLLKKLVDDNKLSGYNLAIMTKEDYSVFRYGYQQIIPEKIAVKRSTLYDLASLSKIVSTTTCILKLISEGSLALDDKVSKYLDIYEKDITIKQCLTHTTGFESDIAGYKALSDEQFMQTIYQFKSLPQYAGKVHYSDINYIYLGFIVAKLKGSLDGYAKEVVFKPLKMNHTCYNPATCENVAATEVTEARGTIRGTVHDGKGYRLNGVSGSAGVFSNLDDMMKFVRAVMDENNPYFTKEERKLFSNPLAETETGNRAAGWIISDPTNEAMGSKYSKHTLYHTGFTGGSMFIDLDKGVALLLLCNRVHPTRNNDAVLKIRQHLHNKLYECIKWEDLC